MSDPGRATPDRVRIPWKLGGVTVTAWFIGIMAAQHFAHAGAWFFAGIGMGFLAAVAFVGWDELERTRS